MDNSGVMYDNSSAFVNNMKRDDSQRSYNGSITSADNTLKHQNSLNRKPKLEENHLTSTVIFDMTQVEF
jgi:hypothetical protein